MNKPLVTIIAVSYNHEAYITECLASLFGQSYDRTELIIIDDFSKDKSVDVICNYLKLYLDSNVKTIFHDINMGLCATLNEAINISNGKYVQLIACDDCLDQYKIERQVNILEQLDNSYCLVYSDCYIMDETSRVLGKTFYQENKFTPPTGNVFMHQINSQFIKTVAALIRRDAIVSVGMYDERLSFEDVDMYLRLSKKYKFIYDGFLGAYWRKHMQNMTNQLRIDKNHLNSRLLAYMKHVHRGDSFVDSLLIPRIINLFEGLYQIDYLGHVHLPEKLWKEVRRKSLLLYLFTRLKINYKYYVKALKIYNKYIYKLIRVTLPSY